MRLLYTTLLTHVYQVPFQIGGPFPSKHQEIVHVFHTFFYRPSSEIRNRARVKGLRQAQRAFPTWPVSTEWE